MQIGWRRDQMALHCAEPQGHERASFQVSDPQREFNTFFRRVDEALAEADVEPHLRIIPDIVGDDRDHVAPAKGVGNVLSVLFLRGAASSTLDRAMSKAPMI